MSPSACIILIGVLVFALGCGDSTPRYTLQQVMLEIDVSKQRLENSLILPGRIDACRGHTAVIQGWLSDPAFEAYLESSRFPGDVARFDLLRREFDGVFAELSGALANGDLETARQAYPRMLGACTRCHDVYRPGL